jgi:nucleoside-diphosphate-sugar epimerase
MAEVLKAYVTGASGFLGSRLTDRLVRHGVTVTCLVRDPTAAAHFQRPGICLVQGDVTDRRRVAETVAGQDWVFHLAAQVQFGVPRRQEAHMRRVNVTGTAHVLEEAWQAGARRIVLCGTVGALGPSGPPGYVGDEQHPHCGRFPSLYVRTKYEAVQVARELIARGAPVIIVLPQAVYGPGSVELLGWQIWLTWKGKMTAVPDSPCTFGYVHVDDVAEGLWLAAQKGRVGESYLLGAALLTLEEFYTTVARHLGVPPPQRRLSPRLLRALAWVHDCVPGGRRLLGGRPLSREEVAMVTEGNWAYLSTKAHDELGWQARPLDEGLPETIAWIQSHDHLFQARR